MFSIPFVLWALVFSAQAAPISLENLPAFEDAALFERLTQMLDRQLRRYQICEYELWGNAKVQEPLNYLRTRLSMKPDLIKLQPTLRRAVIVDAIGALRRFRDVPEGCQHLFPPSTRGKIISARHKIPTAPFVQAACLLKQPGCRLSDLRLWINDLDPACFDVQQAGINGTVENHACFAGDRAVLDSLHKLEIDPVQGPARFAAGLLDTVKRTSPGTPIDLFAVFRELFPQAHAEAFFTLLTAIGASGNSGVVGWLQGIEDRLLLQWLNSTLSAEQIFSLFKEFQLAKIDYQIFRSYAEREHRSLEISGMSLYGWNRHNVMAAFLGCRFRSLPNASLEDLLWITSSAYEGRDFVAHLLRGGSLTDSIENFRVDTKRYLSGGEFGRDFCR